MASRVYGEYRFHDLHAHETLPIGQSPVMSRHSLHSDHRKTYMVHVDASSRGDPVPRYKCKLCLTQSSATGVFHFSTPAVPFFNHLVSNFLLGPRDICISQVGDTVIEAIKQVVEFHLQAREVGC